MRGLTFLRVWRVFLVVTALANIAIGTLDVLAGHATWGVISAVAVLFCTVTVAIQTHAIRRAVQRAKVRPDYAAIAAMEREVYGEVFTRPGEPYKSGGHIAPVPSRRSPVGVACDRGHFYWNYRPSRVCAMCSGKQAKGEGR
jgi:multisubunit Na+/H+ antiporter MnhG subunit